MTWLERICAVHEGSDRPAVIGEAGSVSGRELIGKAVTAADLIVDLDVRAGQPIPPLLAPNAPAVGPASRRPRRKHTAPPARAEADPRRPGRDGTSERLVGPARRGRVRRDG